MYENMKPSGIVPNAYAYNCVISEYCNARMVDKALNVFAEMREKGIAYGVITYNRWAVSREEVWGSSQDSSSSQQSWP